MIELLIVSDDFTGGLDTGVQFAGRGIPTRVVTDPRADLTSAAGDCAVLVVVAQTRHLPAPKAYEVVHSVASRAAALGIPHIYKKTDSALRGNIGAELTAALDASGVRALPFLPALPAGGRITRGGVHFVDGVPVSESVFGRDPFTPVRESNVARLLRTQSEAEVHTGDQNRLPEGGGLWVFDAETDDDLRAAGLRLRDAHMLRACAGCMGFAAELPELLGLEAGKPSELPRLPCGLLMLCGSVNPITRRQLRHAEANGFRRLHIGAEQKLRAGWADTPEGQAALAKWQEVCAASPWLILDANDADDANAESMAYVRANGLSIEDARLRVCDALGGILPRMLEVPGERTLLITGGDTLMTCMDRLGVRAMEPLAELWPGVVLSAFEYAGKTRHVIAKSGGFGSETLLTDLRARLQAQDD